MARRNEGMTAKSRLMGSLFALAVALYCGPVQAYSRIVSLKPNITEIVFDLGEGDKLVGATSFCDHPEAAKKIPRVADYINIDVEKVLSQRPDLILASEENASRKEVEFLKDRGIKVEILAFKTLSDIQRSVEKLGELLGQPQRARQLVDEMRAGLEKLKRRSEKIKPLSSLFIVGYEPLIVVGGNNFIGETIPLLGLRNAAGQSRLPYPVYSIEQLLASAPNIIVELPMGSENTPEKVRARDQWWRRYGSIPAVADGRLYRFEIEKIRAVPELPRALEELFLTIHGGTGD